MRGVWFAGVVVLGASMALRLNRITRRYLVSTPKARIRRPPIRSRAFKFPGKTGRSEVETCSPRVAVSESTRTWRCSWSSPRPFFDSPAPVNVLEYKK